MAEDISISKAHAAWFAIAITIAGGIWFAGSRFNAFESHQSKDMHEGARSQFEEVSDDLYLAVQQLQGDIVALRLDEARQSTAMEALARRLSRVQNELARLQDLLTSGHDPPDNPFFRGMVPDYEEER